MVFKDQLNRKIELKSAPKRIVSLVPSQTELLSDLGLDNEVIGITKFCIHPDGWFRAKTRVGGTKKLNIEIIRSLQPDLIIGNKEENEQEQIEALQNEFPVWMSDIRNLNDTLVMITEVGVLVGKADESIQIKEEISRLFQSLKSQASNLKPTYVAYFIWHNPLITVGADTFINDMLHHCGLTNAFTNLNRYPEINPEQLRSVNPDLIFLSSEPYPFKKRHITEFKTICPNVEVILVDGEMFSWYGSRLLKAPEYFKHLLEQIDV